MTINDIHIIDILKSLNEPLIQKGRKVKWDKHHSIDINENKWYRHSKKKGGYPIQFMMEFFNLDYKQAIDYLVNTFKIDPELQIDKKPKLIIPPQNLNNIKIEIYLKHFRFIAPEIISKFIKLGLLYESAKYHNCVFIGQDDKGSTQHIHQRSIHTSEFNIKSNTSGSNSRWSFNYIGSSNKLYVFESPIDMLSYISLNKEQWKQHSYVALCGLSSKAILNILDTYPFLDNVTLALDNDIIGREATFNILEELNEFKKLETDIRTPTFKDFNEDLKFNHGLKAIEGITDPFEGYKKEVLRKIQNDVVTRKQHTYTDLINVFSVYLYMFDSRLKKQKRKTNDALIESATIAIKIAHQQSTHLEQNIPLDEYVKISYFNSNNIFEFIDRSSSYKQFLKEIDFLKKEFKIKIYHTREDKEKIVESLMLFAKTCIFTHVFLILKERK